MSASTMNHSSSEKWIVPGPPIKRKERDGTFNVSKPSPLTTKRLARPSPHHRHPPKPSPHHSQPPKPSPHHSQPPKPSPLSTKPSPKPLPSNHLLAGYLAHEFLSKGTLLGQLWESDRAASSSGVEPSSNANEKQKVESEETRDRYIEVADLMKVDGVQIPNIVNPTQLARFLRVE